MEEDPQQGLSPERHGGHACRPAPSTHEQSHLSTCICSLKAWACSAVGWATLSTFTATSPCHPETPEANSPRPVLFSNCTHWVAPPNSPSPGDPKFFCGPAWFYLRGPPTPPSLSLWCPTKGVPKLNTFFLPTSQGLPFRCSDGGLGMWGLPSRGHAGWAGLPGAPSPPPLFQRAAVTEGM